MKRHPACLILLVAGLAAAGLALAGCGSQTPMAAQAWDAQARPTSYVVVCDVTQSTMGSRDEYIEGLARVLDGVQYGDQVIVMSAEDSSVQNSELWVEETLPGYRFSPTPRPETDNQLLLDAWQKEEEQRYQQGLDGFASTHDLAAWREKTLSRVRDKLLGRVASGTDLAGALYLAGQLLDSSSTTEARRLVLFSDGLIQTATVNWRSGKVTPRDVERLVKQARNGGSLPHLEGVSVTLIGARAEDDKRLAALRGAWSDYVAACGGQLDPRFFMSHLSETLYGEWLDQRTAQKGG